jgi:hypothetical protein
MTLALRLILVISLIVQSVCAMAQPRCAARAVADSADANRSTPVCACCCGGGGRFNGTVLVSPVSGFDSVTDG